MTELVTTNGKSIAQLAQELGATMCQTNGGNNASRMSELKINSSPDDDAGNPTPSGHFFIKGEDTPAFAPDVTLRVLTHHFQYLNYDNVAKKLVSKSKIIQHFGEEPIDTAGTIRCGKPKSSELAQMAPEQREKYSGVTCFRQVRGLVSFEGKTAFGEKVLYENKPVILMLKGTNFQPFHEEFLTKLPKGRNIWDFQAKLTTKRHKNGSVVWYTFHFEPDLHNPVGLDQDTVDSIGAIADFIKSENNGITKAHNAALASQTMDQRALNAIEGELDNDFVDAA